MYVWTRRGRGGSLVFRAGIIRERNKHPGGATAREMSVAPRGRKVLVADASTALGEALVHCLVEAGAEVVWAGRGSGGGASQVRPVSLDVTSDESVVQL